MSAPSRIVASACFAALLVSGLVPGCDAPDDEDVVADDGETDAGEAGTTGEADTGEPLVCDPPSPYAGGWDIGCCQDDVPPQNGWSPGGVHAGTIMPDWTFDTDQFGEPVRLYDFCHEAIYFDYVALWCGACMAAAPTVASYYDTYTDYGFMTISFVSEAADGSDPTLADVQVWADNFNHNGLVVWGSMEEIWYPFGVDNGSGSFSIALPGTIFIGPNMKIAKMGEPTPQEIELVIPQR